MRKPREIHERSRIGGKTDHADDITAGERCSHAHAAWDNRRLKRGDVIFTELSGCVRRYGAVMMRTVQLGVDDTEAGAVIESLECSIEIDSPGDHDW